MVRSRRDVQDNSPDERVEPVAEGFRAARPPRLADQLYDALLRQITLGKYPEQSRLPSEFDLCAAFGVSRPVVREALFRLQADGIIVSQRGAGSYVRRRPEADVVQVAPVGDLAELVRCMELRRAIEGETAQMAAARRGDEDLLAMAGALADRARAQQAREAGGTAAAEFRFHLAIAAACHNDLFVTALQPLLTRIFDTMRVLRGTAQRGAPLRGEQVQTEYERIYRAIRNGQADEARDAMREHINNARMRTLDETFTPGATSAR